MPRQCQDEIFSVPLIFARLREPSALAICSFKNGSGLTRWILREPTIGAKATPQMWSNPALSGAEWFVGLELVRASANDMSEAQNVPPARCP